MVFICCDRLKRVLVLAISLLMMACGAKLNDLDEYVAEVKARPRGKIEALPEYPPYQTYIYNSLSKRAPFEQPAPKEEKRLGSVEISKRKPNGERQRYPLEQYDITQLQMVGVIGTEKNRQALVKVDDQVYRVAVGDYVGKNDGQVAAVGDQDFSFVELVLAGVDVWTERPRVIRLVSGGGK